MSFACGKIKGRNFNSVRKSELTEDETKVNSPAPSNPEADMEALHRASLSLFSDLSLEGVLRRVIHAAKELSRASYAALGIPDEDGRLETFITLGLSEDEIQKISHQPEGKGLLGEMMRGGQSVRIPEVSEHPKSIGFPLGHPPMHSFLGVPIAAYGRPIGHIYLTDKKDAPIFSEDDQRLIEMLAAHAAAAIENSRLYTKVLESETKLFLRNQELGLINSLATVTSSSIELEELLRVMLAKVTNLFEAGGGEIYLREETEGGYRKAIHHGDNAESFWLKDRFHVGEGYIGEVAVDKNPIWNIQLDEETVHLNTEVLTMGFTQLICVPLTSPSGIVGVLTLGFKIERIIEDREKGLLEAVGAGVGIAVENARLYRQARRVAVLEERERFGMDLHDGVIQSIYAVGLMLDNLGLSVDEDQTEAHKLLDSAIEGLNKTIRDIRAYILDLQPSRIPMDDLVEALERLVREFKANTLIDTEVIIEPEAVTMFENHNASSLFLIAQEALANTAKHAGATRVLLSLRCVDDDCVSFQIIDNGRGFEVGTATAVLGHGLSNMEERAHQIGGEFEIASNTGDGTTVTIRVPVE